MAHQNLEQHLISPMHENQKKRKFTLTIALAIFISGCATTAGYEQLLSSWSGATELDLVRSWGIPDSTYEYAGSKFLTYSSRRDLYIPGQAPSYTTTFIGNTAYSNPTGGTAPINITTTCRTTFEIQNGKIYSWQYKGNGCRARSQTRERNNSNEKLVSDEPSTTSQKLLLNNLVEPQITPQGFSNSHYLDSTNEYDSDYHFAGIIFSKMKNQIVVKKVNGGIRTTLRIGDIVHHCGAGIAHEVNQLSDLKKCISESYQKNISTQQAGQSMYIYKITRDDVEERASVIR